MVPTPQFEVIQVQVVIILLKLQVTHTSTSTVQSTVPVGTSTIVKDKLTTFVKEITSTHLHSMCMCHTRNSYQVQYMLPGVLVSFQS